MSALGAGPASLPLEHALRKTASNPAALGNRRLFCQTLIRKNRIGGAKTFHAVPSFRIAGIQDFIALHNEKETKPFKWTASPERLIAAR